MSDKGASKQRALILQGGGSLGAYAAGAGDRLCSSIIEDDDKKNAKDSHVFDVLAGTSSGAINAAILVSYVIANLKKGKSKRDSWKGVGEHLRNFWGHVSTQFPTLGTQEFQRWYRETWDGLLAIWSNHLGTDEYGAKWESGRRYYSARHLSILGAENVFSTIFMPDSKFFDPLNFRLRFDNEALKRSIEKFATFPIKTSIGEPRLLLQAVDIRSGDVVTFDSYSDKSEYGEGDGDGVIIEYPEGIKIEHLMATMSLPINQKYQTLTSRSGDIRSFWDGAILSNTPLRETNRAHRKFWISEYKKNNPAEKYDDDPFIEYKIPELDVYIVSLWPTKLEDSKVPNDNDFVLDRLWDLFYSDKTANDEQMGKLVTDYVLIIKDLIKVAKKAGKEQEAKQILSQDTISSSDSNPKRKRKELVFERFAIRNILRIALEDDDYTVANKFGDYSKETIDHLINRGSQDVSTVLKEYQFK